MDSVEPKPESTPAEEPRHVASPVQDELIVTWLEETPQPGSLRSPTAASAQLQLPFPGELGERPMRRRRRKLPLTLFVLTCFSTFLAGAAAWNPWGLFALVSASDGFMPLRRTLIAHWSDGLLYMAASLAILLAHEM